MFYSLLIIAVIGFGIFAYKRWLKLPKNQQRKSGKQMALWAIAILVLGLVVTGRAHWLMGVLATLLALAGRVAQFAQYIPLFKKIFGDSNHQQPPTGNTPSNQNMSRQDAADILGVDVNAEQEEIRLAHKKLMQKIHPDRGGSDALAKQINQAKEILSK